MTIQERLRYLREKYKTPLTQKELGLIFNKGQKAISRLETGEAHLQEDDIIAYCKYFGVSADFILGLTDSPNPK